VAVRPGIIPTVIPRSVAQKTSKRTEGDIKFHNSCIRITGPIQHAPSGKGDKKNLYKDQIDGQGGGCGYDESDIPLTTTEDHNGQKKIKGCIDDKWNAAQEGIIEDEKSKTDEKSDHHCRAEEESQSFPGDSNEVSLSSKGTDQQITAHEKEGEPEKKGNVAGI
jgi:hypothetical protein